MVTLQDGSVSWSWAILWEFVFWKGLFDDPPKMTSQGQQTVISSCVAFIMNEYGQTPVYRIHSQRRNGCVETFQTRCRLCPLSQSRATLLHTVYFILVLRRQELRSRHLVLIFKSCAHRLCFHFLAVRLSTHDSRRHTIRKKKIILASGVKPKSY